MRVSIALLFVVAVLASTSPALAQLEPQPTIEVIDAERTVDAGATVPRITT